ncbi:type II secretion system protein [Sulfurovum mangrovi]|uniref:type II secretion system protein n=1 Tax=Sulfurovum mangrovi TaxID=2893889 RepID=UPI001E51B883|nr:type II secretion system protein [Sulfurovum mangrovi]UFH58995.1 type II secretion system GspH family protein [Sulfurovum mangrovi]
MMNSLSRSRKAFSMIELIFVIVVIGILAAIAIPKLAVTRSDAEIAKAKNTVAAVRNSVATKRQKQIMSGDIGTGIKKLSSDIGYDKPIFDAFNDDTSDPVLMYSLTSCKNSDARGCWYTADKINYTYKMPVSGSVDFNVTNNSRFDCKKPSLDNCKLLTQ